MMKKKIAVITVAAVLALTLNGCGNSNSESSADNITVGDNQRLAYAVVTTIEGNEITYMEVEESQLNLSSDEDSDDAEKSNSTENSDYADQQEEGRVPEGDPSMGTPPSNNSQMKGKSDMTGTSATVQIPVGVTVHTTSDTDTTFSRIASGDILKIMFETDDEGNEIVVEIWMVQ